VAEAAHDLPHPVVDDGETITARTQEHGRGDDLSHDWQPRPVAARPPEALGLEFGDQALRSRHHLVGPDRLELDAAQPAQYEPT
jgi:hypothetical protein